MMLSTEKKILYLEDDEFTRVMVQAQLENAGLEVDSFASYSDLIRASNEKNYDLVITDLNVDGHDPAEMVQNIKTIYANIPVVVLSGGAVRVDGANMVISKPLTSEGIKKIIDMLNHDGNDVNLSKVYQFACGDQELLVSYVSTFIDNYEKDLISLKAEVDNHNIKAVKNLTHKMLSSVSYYDRKTLNSLLHQLEVRAEDMDRKQISNIFGQIHTQSITLLHSVRKQVFFNPD